MVGLRTCESEKFQRFFVIVQKKARDEGKIFFLDCGESHIFENEIMEYEDLRGWLIPIEKAARFEEEFLKTDDPEGWEDYICWAVWENEKNPQIRFEFY